MSYYVECCIRCYHPPRKLLLTNLVAKFPKLSFVTLFVNHLHLISTMSHLANPPPLRYLDLPSRRSWSCLSHSSDSGQAPHYDRCNMCWLDKGSCLWSGSGFVVGGCAIVRLRGSATLYQDAHLFSLWTHFWLSCLCFHHQHLLHKGQPFGNVSSSQARDASERTWDSGRP